MPRKRPEALTKREEEYLSFIRRAELTGGATKKSLIAHMGVAGPTVDAYCQTLRRRGLVKSVPLGGHNRFAWVPVDEGSSSLQTPVFMERQVRSIFDLGAML